MTRVRLSFALRFVLLVGLFSTMVDLDEVGLDGLVMNSVTASSAHALGVVLGALGIEAIPSGNRLTLDGSEFIVVAQCTGYEVLLLFIAAVVAVPLPWRFRLRGVAMGVSILASINFLRMISLLTLGAYWRGLHDAAHIYAWPVLLMAIALGIWTAWLNHSYDRLAAGQRLIP